MERKRTLALLALGLVATLVLSPILVQAASIQNNNKPPTNQNTRPDGPTHAASANRIRFMTGTRNRNWSAQQRCEAPLKLRYRVGCPPNCTAFDDLPEFDEEEIDQLLGDYEAMLESEECPAGALWILWAGGASWPMDGEAGVNDEAPEDCTRTGMRLAIRPIIASEDLIVFKVVRGVVVHDGERYQVEGIGAVSKEDGVFVMKLEGGGFSLKAIGRVHRGRWSLRVAMKGRMTVDGADYAFRMRGKAFRLSPLTPEAVPEAEDAVEPTISS